MDSLLPAFLLLLPSLPLTIVYLVGIIFSSTKIGLYRRAAAMGLTGFIGLLLGQMVHAGGTLMTLPAYRGEMPIRELGIRLAAINLAGTMLTLAGTILLLLALFADRDTKQPVGQPRW